MSLLDARTDENALQTAPKAHDMTSVSEPPENLLQGLAGAALAQLFRLQNRKRRL
jgi:hypothetical protein